MIYGDLTVVALEIRSQGIWIPNPVIISIYTIAMYLIAEPLFFVPSNKRSSNKKTLTIIIPYSLSTFAYYLKRNMDLLGRSEKPLTLVNF